MFKGFTASFAVVVSLVASSTFAQDRALIVDVSQYRYLSDLPADGRIQTIRNRLRADGFEVEQLDNPTLSRMRAAVFALEAGAQGAEGRTVVVLRGHVVNDGERTWVLSQGGRTPDRFDLGSKAFPFYLLDRALGASAGQAVLAVIPSQRPLEGLVDLENGVGALDMPQGVTAITGSSRDIQRSLTTLLRPGATTADLLQGSAEVSGFVSRGVAFTVDEQTQPEDTGEIAYWSAVRDIGTAEAYEAYLNRYPDGVFAEAAEEAIGGVQVSREEALKEAEAALRLNRTRRQEIQRALALLGFDPRGIDGVFGPATRRAVAAWQEANRYEAHGYLDRDQLFLLQEQARRRAAELEEEARQKRLIEEERDRAYWNGTGISGREADLRLYLRRYPDGLFADVARDQIADYEAERRAELSARERAAWDRAAAANTIAAYRAFLSEYPDGSLAETARGRILELEENTFTPEQIARLEANENAVAANPAARLLIEGRLAGLGLEPGPTDGRFDDATRKAIRRFQKARGLNVTGYMDQPTMVRLLLGG